MKNLPYLCHNKTPQGTKLKIMTIEKAVANFLQFVSNGWNIEVALESCHDTVYDLISLKDFGAKCLRAVGVAKIANLNQN